MNISATHNKRRRGYTLIEILIVMFIISIVTSVAVLSIRHNENKQMETFASELAQMLTLAEEEAMLQSSVLGLSIGTDTVQFSSLQLANDGKKNNWQPLQDTALGAHSIPSSFQLQLKISGDDDETQTTATPQIIISTNGDVTPFTLYVGKKGEKPRYVVIGDADGTISSKALS